MKPGLENITVADTRLSCVNGQKGTLLVCGLDSEDLKTQSYKSLAGLLLQEEVKLGPLRSQAYRELHPYFDILQERHALAALSLGLSVLQDDVCAAGIIAAIPVILGANRHGSQLLPPNPKQDHVTDFLRLFKAENPSSTEALALEQYFVTVAEHGMNASTFTCRVVASTRATRKMAISAALAALSGPLHGGAPGPVLDLLDELKQSSELEATLDQKISRGERLMGFGHRVYKTRDPRAALLQSAVSSLGTSPRLGFAEIVEQAAEKILAERKPGRSLRTNVEFYTAILLEELGFERSWFTPLFAMGRVLGWLAHYDEQLRTGRLIRPKARYIGPKLDKP